MYLATCKRIHASCIASLTALRNANIFDDSVVLNLLMGDQSDEERLLNAEGINPHATLKKFRGELQVDLKRLADLRKSRWKW